MSTDQASLVFFHKRLSGLTSLCIIRAGMGIGTVILNLFAAVGEEWRRRNQRNSGGSPFTYDGDGVAVGVDLFLRT